MGQDHRKRLREKAEQHFDSLKQHEVLELMLFFSYPRIDTNPIAHALIDKFGSLYNVCHASKQELTQVFQVGEKAADFLRLMPKLFRAYQQSAFDDKLIFQSTQYLGEYCVSLLFGRSNEAVYLLCLDNSKRLVKQVKLAEGTPGEVYIEPRMIVEQVVHTATTGVVLCHNHPSGTLLPSNQDLETTAKIKNALHTIDIALIDHIIEAGGNFISLREHGFQF